MAPGFCNGSPSGHNRDTTSLRPVHDNQWEHAGAGGREEKPEVEGHWAETENENLSGLDELHLRRASW